MSNPNERDPFDTDSAPAMSFKEAPVGTVKKIRASGKAEMVQSRDFESGDPVYWDPNRRGKKTTVPNDRPIMSAVINGVDPETGEALSLWAQKPSALFSAIGAAQKAANHRIDNGTEVAVKLTGTEPNPNNPNLHDKKLYAVKVTAPAPSTQGDAFGDEPPF